MFETQKLKKRERERERERSVKPRRVGEEGFRGGGIYIHTHAQDVKFVGL